MKIIILGAGRVGYSVAESLVSERNDITVIDTDAQRLQELQDRFDLRGVVGNGIDVQVLAEAGAADTDLLIACAAQDETNLVCCKIAHMVFGVRTRVARVRAAGFDVSQPLLGPEGFAVDTIICPEASVMRYILKLIEYPDALQVREFAGGRACLSSVRARLGAPGVGMRIGDVRMHHPELAMRIVAIYRRFADEPDRFVRCDGNTRIEPGDEVFVLAASEHLQQMLNVFHRPSGQPARAVRRILIAGGDPVSLHLAQALASEPGRFIVKIIESDPRRCEVLAAALPSEVLVLQGNPTDEDLFADESVEETDLFLALTEDDENNIMASLLAKRMGASRVLALINRRSYADLMHGTQIDIALSPAQAMLGEFLAHVRKGDVQAVHSLRRGVAEALEIVARGDRKSSKVVGRPVEALKLPAEVHIGLIIRGLPDTEDIQAQAEGVEPEVIIPHSHTVIESNDHVVFFLPNKRLVQEVERLFRVSATFF
ncbi:Trk system potassium transporter TrkA [Comamonas aquatica]|jgi:trk system potassium uptake protein TrkA|uniref:Trk system potassium uptake protein TrkA n=1 Tax=Comamonas aquatica TaxID=225991 RepID=A0AA42W1Y3_9BURK|nr:Trk system potassium transporter TrkA [Comamonas aquatica]MDH1430231.1 Trk system potassium transporter TrkA [Comamonas aquatica]MDH1605925.1 Trk system potassium transporter TrkA [Comamonas aquatica]MDH1617865.1 Trk system potassium transporter TrkA [Comamonas aquatica]MDH1903662.1 Trk system potassium transporter TrkA [Comamonas aquatica]MDH2005765.1 Trk system potassium transporter TrkA [Comamonas aquatica]